MNIKLRHGLYLAVMAVLFLPRLVLMGAAWLNDQANEIGWRMHSWAYREKYKRIQR